jgi:hypothetical protein
MLLVIVSSLMIDVSDSLTLSLTLPLVSTDSDTHSFLHSLTRCFYHRLFSYDLSHDTLLALSDHFLISLSDTLSDIL